MITDINSEDRLVQQTFAEHLRRTLTGAGGLRSSPYRLINAPRLGRLSEGILVGAGGGQGGAGYATNRATRTGRGAARRRR